MNPFFHIPSHLREKSFLPGHGRSASPRRAEALPGIDPNERCARRMVWARNQGKRQIQHQRAGRVTFVTAMLALMVILFAALATSTNALERATASKQVAESAAFEGEIMRPTLHLEARTLALFNNDDHADRVQPAYVPDSPCGSAKRQRKAVML